MNGVKRARVDSKQKPDRQRQPRAGPSTEREEDSDAGSSQGSDSEGSDDGEDDDEESANGEEDDYEAIVQANEDAQLKPKKKRKRALPQQAFGSLLSSLISAPAPTKPLKPLHPAPADEALEKKAVKLLQARKHERLERGHIPDVIAGWTPRPNVPFSQWAKTPSQSTEYAVGGADKEKELRRLAQKGAVRLFNAIKAAQTTEQDAEAGTAPSRAVAIKDGARRSIKEASPAGSVASSIVASRPGLVTADKGRTNILGTRGRQEALTNLSKASFLELFKASSSGKAN